MLYRGVKAIVPVFAGLCLQILAVVGAWAAPAEDAGGRTESPYFFVRSDNPSVDRLPLKDTRVDVRVVGVIADVSVTQYYKNEGTRPIEARYVFPGSTRAAVYAMNVRLAERLLTAQIRERRQARAEYEGAKRAGKTAALLEQHRPNVFQMNVANIMPGDDVKVELRYTELLVPRDGQYRFVFPTVVGPRYNGAAGSGDGSGNGAGGGAGNGTGEQWISTPYLHAGKPAPAGFVIEVDVAAPIPLQTIASPSHQIQVRKKSNTEARIGLVDTAANENNRDFVLDYALAGERIESGILLSRGEKEGENFFLAMVEPPRAVKPAQVVPREYVFIVDISGSMHGFPLDTAKVLLEDLVGGLRASDTFNVMLFAGSQRMLAPRSLPATPANIARALTMLHEQGGGGGTELVPALRKALALPHDADRARTFVAITDGYVSVEREIFGLIRQNLAQANLFAFGIGSSVNRHLIEGMARAGQGEPFVVLDESAAAEAAARFRRMIDNPVLTHIRARFEGLEVYDVEPVSLPDVFAARPVLLYGKWRGDPKGQLVLEGRSADGPFRATLAVKGEQVSPRHSALRYLWARERVAILSDQETLDGGDGEREAILALGLRYNLLTRYTSFVAVDHVVRAATGDGATVDQPSPLPKGVSDLAVGAAVPSTPEPALWWLLAVAGLGLAFALRRRMPVVGRVS